MTIAAQTFSTTFTATNEGTTFSAPRLLVGITFRGTGLTADQILTIRDSATPGSGSILADYVIMAVTDNADLWVGREQWVSAMSISNTTVGGTWQVTAFFQDHDRLRRVKGA